MSEEKLEVLRKYEQEKIDKLLSKYITFCGKVPFFFGFFDDHGFFEIVDLIA